MPPNFQRYLPFFLIALVLLFVLPTLLRGKSSSTSTKTLAAETIDAVNLIDQGEQAYRQAHGRYTSHLADLVPLRPRLGKDLAAGLSVTIDSGAGGKDYVAQVVGANLSLVRARSAAKLVVSSCLVVKSASGVSCPAAARG
jgi:hypothetical protein